MICPNARIEAENSKLRKTIKRLGDQSLKQTRDAQSVIVERNSLAQDVASLRATLSGLGYSSGDRATDSQTRSNTRLNAASHVDCVKEISELVRIINQHRRIDK